MLIFLVSSVVIYSLSIESSESSNELESSPQLHSNRVDSSHSVYSSHLESAETIYLQLTYDNKCNNQVNFTSAKFVDSHFEKVVGARIVHYPFIHMSTSIKTRRILESYICYILYILTKICTFHLYIIQYCYVISFILDLSFNSNIRLQFSVLYKFLICLSCSVFCNIMCFYLYCLPQH